MILQATFSPTSTGLSATIVNPARESEKPVQDRVRMGRTAEDVQLHRRRGVDAGAYWRVVSERAAG